MAAPVNPAQTKDSEQEPMLCHVGPDAGWPVLKPFLEATERTLSVAMYDFNAEYIAKTSIDTIQAKKLKAVLTWDDSMTAPETTIRGKLKTSLKRNLDGWVVRCGAGRRFASAYHEKVAVRDSEASGCRVAIGVFAASPTLIPSVTRQLQKACTARAIANDISLWKTTA